MTGQLFVNNQSTITICTNVGNYDGAIRYAKKSNKIAKMVEKEKLWMKYVSTENNIADIFTKALGPQRFEKLRERLGVKDKLALEDKPYN